MIVKNDTGGIKMEKMNVSSERNITLIMDFYELTMSYNYFKMGKGEQIVYFDMFYRKNPDNGGFVIFAGLQQLIEAIQDMHFSEGDIEYLRSLHIFDEDFFDYLRNFKFTGTIYAVKEGTPVFPYEPLVTVKAKLIEAQLIETFLLVTINHQSLIATKAHRVCQEAKGRPVMEFGARRAQGYDGGTLWCTCCLYWWGCWNSYNICRSCFWRTSTRNNGTFFCSII